MILIALGSNVSGPWGNPADTVERAIQALNQNGVELVRASRPFITRAFGKTDQPDFVNAVVRVASKLEPEALLARLHAIETEAGRIRAERWGPRTLDLDLIDYNGLVRSFASGLTLPHPGLAERLFVLKPLAEIAPGWSHPVLGKRAATLIRSLAAGSAGDEV